MIVDKHVSLLLLTALLCVTPAPAATETFLLADKDDWTGANLQVNPDGSLGLTGGQVAYSEGTFPVDTNATSTFRGEFKRLAAAGDSVERTLAETKEPLLEKTRATALPYRTLGRYAVLKLKRPVTLAGKPNSAGIWVKGNSGWGPMYWVSCFLGRAGGAQRQNGRNNSEQKRCPASRVRAQGPPTPC